MVSYSSCKCCVRSKSNVITSSTTTNSSRKSSTSSSTPVCNYKSCIQTLSILAYIIFIILTSITSISSSAVNSISKKSPTYQSKIHFKQLTRGPGSTFPPSTVKAWFSFFLPFSILFFFPNCLIPYGIIVSPSFIFINPISLVAQFLFMINTIIN